MKPHGRNCLVLSPEPGSVQWISSEDVLKEILQHSNFDRESWSVGDTIVFEDGTQSQIETHPDASPDAMFYSFREPVAADFTRTLTAVVKLLPDDSWAERSVSNWTDLFDAVEQITARHQTKWSLTRPPGCAVTAVATMFLLIPVWVLTTFFAALINATRSSHA